MVQQGDIIYLLSSVNRRVYRRSISSGAYLNPYVVGLNQGFSTLAPTTMAYSSAQQRLYLGYATGAIRYINVNAATPAETAFVDMPAAVDRAGERRQFPGRTGGSVAQVINASGVITATAGTTTGTRRRPRWIR